MSNKEKTRGDLFGCKTCGGNYFVSRKDCCPIIYKNIIDRTDRVSDIMEFEKRIAGKNFREDPVKFGNKKVNVPVKYLPRRDDVPGQERPKGTTIKQYRRILKKLDFKNKVVIDYGCSLAHASNTIKNYSENNTYIGVDISLPGMVIGNAIWSPDYLYVPDYNSDRCLGNIKDGSVDLVIASRITQWKKDEGWIANFLDEVTRVLKPNGYLYFYSNSDKFGGGKRYLFDYLLKNFTCGTGDQKKVFSKKIWGGENAHLKRDEDMNSKKELMKPVRGLFRLRKK